MRFLADMGISRTVVRYLRDRGHEATHLSEERQHRLSDQAIIMKARHEDRIILTHDLDFARLMATGIESKPSAIIFRLTDMRPDCVLAHLLHVLDEFAEDLVAGALVTVGDSASRCRLLPIYKPE